MVLIHDTSSCRDDHFCLIIFKSHQFLEWSYRHVLGHDSGMFKIKVPALALTFNLATWLIHATHCLVVIISLPNIFQIPPCMVKLWVGHESGRHKI